jgi:hypothetical protein
MTFEQLDRAVAGGAPHLDDDAFGALVHDWLVAAHRIISAPAVDGRDVARKLRTLGGVLDGSHGSVVGARELAMGRAIVADLERLASLQ